MFSTCGDVVSARQFMNVATVLSRSTRTDGASKLVRSLAYLLVAGPVGRVCLFVCLLVHVQAL